MSEHPPRPADVAVPSAATDATSVPEVVGRPQQTQPGGWSAARRAEQLRAASDPAAGAWAAGAEGERRVAAALSELPDGWTVLHDRLLRPGLSEANLDHIVIGPGGLFLVDAKNRAGLVTEWEGGLFQRVTKDGERHTESLAGELKKVHGMAAYMSVESASPVIPVLCLAGAQEAAFGEPVLLRGVWVVPMSRLVRWLEARPHVLDREGASRRASQAMTDFPSTTTDPELLAAMGLAAARQRRARRRQRNAAAGRHAVPLAGATASRSAPRRRASRASRVLRLVSGVVGVGLALTLVVTVLPSVLAEGDARLAASAHPSATPAVTAAPGPPATDCTSLTQAQLTSILGRTVKPVATSSGCAWGTRLDDPTTVVVSIRTSARHAAYDMQLVTSVTQRRVVYGTAYDPHGRPATALWVAAGEPVGTGAGLVTALADTHVVVSTTMLKVTDDRARAMALAIAEAVNRQR